jgi:CRISPR type IV-associated protein Csf3
MVPFAVTAELATAPVVTGPLMLDGLLLFGIGAEMGRLHPSGIVAPEDVIAQPLPLARVEVDDLWWWAASQATPRGREEQGHLHRRTPFDLAARWTSAGAINQAAGPDKMLRVPFYRRVEMLRITWTGVGDPQRVGELLKHVNSVGKLRTQGHGLVRSWTVATDGPPLETYARDIRLRHLPVAAVRTIPPRTSASYRLMPLRAPYYEKNALVPCLQVVSS